MICTLLPVADLKCSAQMLDDKRLLNQAYISSRLARSILLEKDWHKIPAARMWGGREGGLLAFHDFCIEEAMRRGLTTPLVPFNRRAYVLPMWFGDEKYHGSLRSTLLREDPAFYRRYDWKDNPEDPCLWPILS